MYFLFILTVKSIFSSVIGSQFYKWYSTTTMGLYFQSRIDQFMEYISNKYNIELTKKQEKFEVDYPLVMKRIDEIEKKQSERFPHLIERIKKLEKWSHPDRQKEFEKVIKEIKRKIK